MRAEQARRRTKKDLEAVSKNAEKIRNRCQSLYEFVKEFWHILEPGREFKGGWAIEAVCKCLEAVTDKRIQYLLITIPPGMAKSLLVAVFWPAWELGPRKMTTMRYLSTSYSRPNVIRDNRKMQRLLESEKYQTLWGDTVTPSKKWGEEKFETEQTGFREGRPFVSMTGGRGDRVLIDDPHSVDSAESDAERRNTIRTFREAIPDRVNDPTESAIVVIMQRLHAGDVAGTILELGLPYVHLNLPMEFEERRKDPKTGKMTGGPCEIWLPKVANDNEANDNELELFFRDPRTDEGELLFPERFPRDAVDRLKKQKTSYAWAGQYQQRPTAREGGMFKRAWFEGKIIARDRLPRIRSRVRAWDRASKKQEPGTRPDFTAGLLMGRDGPDYYIENVRREQDSPGEIRRLMKSTAETDPRGTTIRLPIEPGQAGIDQQERDITYFSGYGLDFHRPTGSKELRADGIATQAEFGHVYLVNSVDPELGLDPWIEVFLEELCSFPAGANDDQVDVAADGFNFLSDASDSGFEYESIGGREVAIGDGRDSRYNLSDRGIGFGNGTFG